MDERLERLSKEIEELISQKSKEDLEREQIFFRI
jgi:Holliday junction resolvasome RuvABC endonuclease subunit